MFLKKNVSKGITYWSLAESYREGGKPKHRIIQSLGDTERALETLKEDTDYEKFYDQLSEYINSSNRISPILKYPGAKWSISEWIISKFPIGYEKMTYLEPYAGSLAVYFNKKPSRLETINDMDKDIPNLFKVIRSRKNELAEQIYYTPWSRSEYYESYERTGDELEDARRFLVRCWQAHATKTNARTGWRHSTTKDGPCMPRQWSNVPERIDMVADRLKNAQIENMPDVELIKKYNNKDVLIYADPPYLLSTRSSRLYKHEMTEEQHVELLSALIEHTGPAILSGYDNDLYNNILTDWKKEVIKASTEKGGSKIEVLWINPIALSKANSCEQLAMC